MWYSEHLVIDLRSLSVTFSRGWMDLQGVSANVGKWEAPLSIMCTS